MALLHYAMGKYVAAQLILVPIGRRLLLNSCALLAPPLSDLQPHSQKPSSSAIPVTEALHEHRFDIVRDINVDMNKSKVD